MEHQIIRSNITTEKANGVRELYQKHKEKLDEYIERLLWWNKKINLVSRDVSRETIERHVEHSLILSQSSYFQNAGQIIDTGTGGGLPGIPLAIVFPEKKIGLNDVVSKKIIACKHISSGLGLGNIDGKAASIEQLEIPAGSIIISKHAFKINDLISMVNKKPWNGIVLLKGGKEVEDELKGLKEILTIEIINLDKEFQSTFYKGKAMVEITRKEKE